MRPTLIALAFLLASCAPLPQVQPGSQPQISGEAPSHWRARGRFAFRGEDSRSGQFDWQQQGDQYNIRLFGTFGLGSVRIEGDPHWAEITSGEDSWFTDTPELTLFQITGVSLPVSELANWMTGRIDSQEVSRWQVTYSNLQQVTSYQLPGRVDLQAASQSLSIVVSSWELPDA